MPRKRTPPEPRFWAKVERPSPTECWPWRGTRDAYGYGQFRAHPGDSRKAHRYAYELLVGPPPPILDHTCHEPSTCAGGVTCPHRRCCNPAHMRSSTTAENALRGQGPQAKNARKTHCPEGHVYDHLWTDKHGREHRDCLQCRRRRARDYQAQKRRDA